MYCIVVWSNKYVPILSLYGTLIHGKLHFTLSPLFISAPTRLLCECRFWWKFGMHSRLTRVYTCNVHHVVHVYILCIYFQPISKCNAEGNNSDKLYHYRVTMSPHTNFLVRSSVVTLRAASGGFHHVDSVVHHIWAILVLRNAFFSGIIHLKVPCNSP